MKKFLIALAVIALSLVAAYGGYRRTAEGTAGIYKSILWRSWKTSQNC